MANIDDILNYFSYEELRREEDKWVNFYKTKLSSFYSSDDINSAKFSVFIRSFSKFLGSLDLLYEKNLENIALNTVSNEFIYNNFGFLLKSNDFNYSSYEYKTFLKNLINILFEGLRTSNGGKTLFSSLAYVDIYLDLFENIANKSIKSVGLDHINSRISHLGKNNNSFILNSKTLSSDFYNFKDLNDYFVTSKYIWDKYTLNFNECSIIFNIVVLLASSISQPKVRLLFDEIEQDFEKPNEVYNSFCFFRSRDNFTTVYESACFLEDNFQFNKKTDFIFTDEDYQIDNILDLVSKDLTHTEIPVDSYKITHDFDNDPSGKITEQVLIEEHCVDIQRGILYGPDIAYGGIYYDPRCMSHYPAFCETPTDPLYYDHLAFYDDDGPNAYGENFRPEQCADNEVLELDYIIFVCNDDTQYPWLNGGTYQIKFGEGYTVGQVIHATSVNNTFYENCKILKTESLFYEHPDQLTNQVCYFVNNNVSYGNNTIYGDFQYGDFLPVEGVMGNVIEASGFYV